MNIKAKILIPSIVTVLLVAAAILFSTVMLFSREVEDSTEASVAAASRVALHNLNFLKAEASIAALIVAESQEVVDALAAGDNAALLLHAKRLQDEADAEYCTITDTAGVVILRTHNPRTGDSILSQANVRAALDGKNIAVVEKGTVISLAVRSGAPIRSGDGEIIGSVSIGYRLDTDRFVDSIQEMLDCEAGVFLGDVRVSTTVRGRDGERAVGTRADPRPAEAAREGRSYTGSADVVGRAALTQYTPILGPDGGVIGMLFVGKYVDGMTATIRAFILRGAAITLAMLGIAVAIILFTVNKIVSPIRAMTRAASALAVGDTDIDVTVTTRDEMSTLAAAFNAMIENTRRQVRIVKNIAGGGLAIPLEMRSDKDVMNQALENLNQTIQAQAAEIRAENERVKIMLDATPLAARLWDRDYRIVDCNEEAVRIFGFKSKQEYLERYFEISPLLQPDGQTTREKIREMVGQAFATGRSAYEWMYRLLDGTPVPSEVTMVRIPYKGDFVVASYSRDLREHKRMLAEIEEQDGRLRSMNQELEAALADAEKANLAKSDFLASMSHEMRTPLNTVIGFSELILENDLPEATAVRVDNVYNAGLTLLSIINNILDIAKIEAGKLTLSPGEYDVPSMINDVMVQNALRIGSKPIRLVLAVSRKMPARLYGDELRIKSIINNLLSNALKYTESGRVKFALWSRREDADEGEGEGTGGGDAGGVRVFMRVTDTGCGIRPDDIATLFNEYVRLDGGASRKVDGTGLGLAITKRFAEMMGGGISVKSTVGKGSSFAVEILQRRVGDRVVGPEVAENLKSFRYSAGKRRRRAERNRPQLPYARVLVVDDNVTNLEIAKAFMLPYGMRIDCVTGGRAAIDAIRGGGTRYNAIFLDHMMPGMDGIETARRIREIGTDYAARIPIIALTANAIAGNEQMFLEHGFQAFISKPINIDLLDKVIRDYVRDRSLEKERGLEGAGREDGRAAPAAGPAADADPDNAGPDPDFAPFAARISGLDAERGLAKYGRTKTFVQVLRSYAVNSRGLIDGLRGVTPEGLPGYAITVHGIKGSSRNVCADAVGDRAEALEKAAKAGDADFVRRNNPAFLTELDRLTGGILQAIDAMERATPKPERATPDEAALRELAAACNEYNFREIDAVMERLDGYAYTDDGGLMAWLRESVIKMDYAGVKDRLEGLGYGAEG